MKSLAQFFAWNRSHTEKLTLISCLIGLFIILFWGLPDAWVYSQSDFIWLPLLIIYGIVLFLLVELLRLFNVDSGIGCFLTIVLAISFTITSAVRLVNELNKNGVTTRGFIYNKWRGTKKMQIQGKFWVEGKEYLTLDSEDRDDKYTIGDTVIIIYSARYPETNGIIKVIPRK
jgi:hypothetical protein